MKLVVSLSAGMILAAVPFTAMSQSLGAVTAYNAETLRTYSEDGTRISATTPLAELPALPAAIVLIQPGGRLGIINRANQRIFVRGMDVEFDLTAEGRRQAACRPVVSGNRAAGRTVAGTRAGGGTSADCAL